MDQWYVVLYRHNNLFWFVPSICLKIFDKSVSERSGWDDCYYPEWCSSKLLSHTDRLVGVSRWIFLIKDCKTELLVLITIEVLCQVWSCGVEGDRGVRELVEGEGGGGVDTNTRVVGGDVLTTTLSQEEDQHRGDTGDNLNNSYVALHSPQPFIFIFYIRHII